MTATNEGTNVPLTTKTTGAGTYSFESVQSGTYRIAVEMQGFKKFVSTGNVLQVGQPTTVNVALEVGAAGGDTVEVSGTAEVVQTSTSGNIGTTVDTVSVNTLPIVGGRGRNPLLLVLFQPGVQNGTNAGGSSSVNGARDRAWNYTLDGVDINESSTPGSQFTPIRTNPNMIQEFRVVTASPTADLGGTSGGQIMMVTKSGTNTLHGSFDLFYQTPRFMANDPNNKIYAKPIGRPQWVQKIWNGAFGGPVLFPKIYDGHNRTFFFVDVQRLTLLRSATHTSTVYTPTARNGIIRYISKNYMPGCKESGTAGAPGICARNTAAGVATSIIDNNGNVLPQYANYIGTYNVGAMDPLKLGLDPTTMAIIKSVPSPNDYTVGDGLNTAGYTFTAPEMEKQVDVTFKIDHNFTQRNSMFVRVSWGHQMTMGDLGNGGAPMYPGGYDLVDTRRTPRNFAINWRITPTNSMTNEVVAGMNRFGFGFDNGNPDPDSASPLVLNNMTMPESNWSSNRRTLTTMQLGDNLKWMRGAHSFAFGVMGKETRHIDDRGSIGSYDARLAVGFGTSTSTGNPVNVACPAAGTGSTATYCRPSDINTTYDAGIWSTSINDMLGKVGNMTQGFVSKNGKWMPGGTVYNFESRFPSTSMYAQDSWKIKPNLLLDLGMRWEIYMAPGNTTDTILHPDQPTYIGAAPSSSLKWVPGNVISTSWGNVGPSVGVAWDPFKDGKSSVRASYRIAYDPINTFVLSGGIFQGLPGLTYAYAYPDFGLSGARLRQGLPTIAPPATQDPIAMRQPVAFSSSASITVMDPRWQPARTNMWSFGLQRELKWKILAEANYIGHHADRLAAGNALNQVDVLKNGFVNEFNIVKSGGESAVINQMLAGDPNLGGKTGSAYVRATYPSYLSNGDVALLAANLNARGRVVNGVRTQQIALNGFNPYFFTPYPQFIGGMGVMDSGGWSNYHALQTQIKRQFTNGLQFQFHYTWSKSLDTNSFDPTQTRYTTGNTQSAGNTLQNIYNRGMNYARSDFDRRHVFSGNLVYDLPFGKGKRFLGGANGAVDRIIGGWQMTHLFTFQSGRPMTAYGSAYTISDQVRAWANCSTCSADMGNPHWEGPAFAGGTKYFFTPEQRASFSTAAPGQQGNMGRNSITMLPYKEWGAAIHKEISINDRVRLKFGLDVQNVLNSVMYGIPYTGLTTSTLFGEMSGPSGIQNFNSARRMQTSALLTF